jgi:ubiquinone/menaquinone biosynthesis C-methylase UbiE
MEMKKAKSNLEVVLDVLPDLKDKIIIDVGCGEGDLVRDLTQKGAHVTGIDKEEILAKASLHTPAGDEKYVREQGEKLPFEDNYADLVVYFASFHHIPKSLMRGAVMEVRRVLKPGGIVIFVEPLGRKGSYFELVKLVGNERKIQRRAYRVIKKVVDLGFERENEWVMYFERSFEMYESLLGSVVANVRKKKKYLKEARKKTKRFAGKENIPFNEYRYRSICRVDVFREL